MKKSAIFLGLLSLGLIAYIGVVNSQEEDYLVVPRGGSKITPSEEAESGDLVTVEITLEQLGIIPTTSELNITLKLVHPRVELTIDAVNDIYDIENKTYVEDKEITYTLPTSEEGGIDSIFIKIFGEAPTVEKRTTMDVVVVKTYVDYPGGFKGYQDEIKMPLIVTNPTIEATVDALDTAREKLKEAENSIDALKAQGVDTTELEVKLENARGILETANTLYEDEKKPILAKDTAERARVVLDEIISDADELKQSVEQKSAITRYALIGVGVVVAIIILLLVIRGRREELG